MDLFDVLHKEKKQNSNSKIKIIPPKCLDSIIYGFEKFISINCSNLIEDMYINCERCIPQEYSAKDVELFSLIITDYQLHNKFECYSGLYLSALINHCKEDNLQIYTGGSDKPVHFLAHYNEKNLTIYGDVGNDCANHMFRGKLIINGNAGLHLADNLQNGLVIVNGNCNGYVGYLMQQGKIIINGNVDCRVGQFMNSGKIIVNGNVKDYLGCWMNGGSIILHGDIIGLVGYRMYNGKIYINGNYNSLSSIIFGGNIYHKDKQIIKDGKKVG